MLFLSVIDLNDKYSSKRNIKTENYCYFCGKLENIVTIYEYPHYQWSKP
jgi:hypothetical protein